MAKGFAFLNVAFLLWTSAALGDVGNTNGHGLQAPTWVPGPNLQAPVTSNFNFDGAEGGASIGRATEAFATAAVGLNDDLRTQLAGQVGGQWGQQNRPQGLIMPEGSDTESVVGLDLAAFRTQHANQMGNRPESVAGLTIAGEHMPEMALQRLKMAPIQWVFQQVVPQQTEGDPSTN